MVSRDEIIPELDDTAHHLRVSLEKAHNYFHVVAKEYLAVKADFERGRYGTEIPFETWLLRKVRRSSKSLEKEIRVFCYGLASSEREKLEMEEQERFAAQRREKAERRQQREAEKSQREAEKSSTTPHEDDPWEAAMRKEALDIAAMRPRRAKDASFRG